MKILHLASYIGNVGDNASHAGLRYLLNSYFPSYELVKLEIRRFYKNYKHSDKLLFISDFVDYINSFDLILIGGGGFLDYWVPNSATGTTIDIEAELIDKIKKPTFFLSVGCAPHGDIPEGNVDKFKKFLDRLLNNNKVRLAFRNDGSLINIEVIPPFLVGLTSRA